MTGKDRSFQKRIDAIGEKLEHSQMIAVKGTFDIHIAHQTAGIAGNPVGSQKMLCLGETCGGMTDQCLEDVLHLKKRGKAGGFRVSRFRKR